MIVIYPINGKNERMGSLFSTPKHLLLYRGKELIKHSIETIHRRFENANIVILTNAIYFEKLNNLFKNTVNISIKLIEKTNSQIETLRKATDSLSGPVLFVDCDILPLHITDFDETYTTVFTFENTSKLLNYSNYKVDKHNSIVDCNEKQKVHKNAGAGIYYFPEVSLFNRYADNCKNISECVKKVVESEIRAKINNNSIIDRFGTLQDIYIDNFSFRKPNAVNLSTGFTDNRVIRDKQTVIKIGGTVEAENVWYSCYQDKKHIPTIMSYEHNKLVLEYVERDSDVNLDDVFDLVDTYRYYTKLNNLDFGNYINSIKNHLARNTLITNSSTLLSKLEKLSIVPTFCHGDLSVMNLIPTKVGLKLIDPLYSKSKFGSYELDIAKLCFSSKFYKNDSASFNYVKSKSRIEYLDILIAAEAVRVATYKKEYSFIAENLINELI